MTVGRGELAVEVEADRDTDNEELSELVRRLRGELLELDVETVELIAQGDAPAGAKGAELFALGGMLVHFVRRPDVLSSIIRGVQSWLERQRARGVKLTLDGDSLEVTGLSSKEQDRLIDIWVARHASPG